jgi:cytochrome b pre-mRNA-processing protein 3
MYVLNFASITRLRSRLTCSIREACFLPPTFQSWFTVTNLHIWMLTVRFRALPETHGRFYEQALVDHFFLDIEDRIRAVLQPPDKPTEPYTHETPFYRNPHASSGTDAKKRKSRAPDRIVNRQMKIFKEQWAGMGLAFDLALTQGDMEMAAAVWRNILGARGAQGIALASDPNEAQTFRRSVNLVGGEVVNVAKVNIEQEEKTDDGSGVHDFPPEESDKYLTYPGVMLDVVQYVRKELARLQSISDEDILSGDWEKLKFSNVR